MLNGIHRGEEVAVGLVARLIDAVRTLVDELFRYRGTLVEESLVVGDTVVFAVGAFEEADSRLQGHGRPLGDQVEILIVGDILDGIVDVVQDRVHNQLTGVTRLFQVGVGRREGPVVPGYIAESFHLLEVEVGPEETGNTVVVLAGRLAVAAVRVLQVEVDVTQVTPVPTAACGGNGACESYRCDGQGEDAYHILRFAVSRLGRRKLSVEVVGEGLQLFLVVEIGLGRKRRQREPIEIVGATSEGKGSGRCQNIYEILFHRYNCIRVVRM